MPFVRLVPIYRLARKLFTFAEALPVSVSPEIAARVSLALSRLDGRGYNVVVFVNHAHLVITLALVSSMGSHTERAAEVFTEALDHNKLIEKDADLAELFKPEEHNIATGVVVVTHRTSPFGLVSPTDEDRSYARRLDDLSSSYGIALVDYLVVNPGPKPSFWSYRHGTSNGFSV